MNTICNIPPAKYKKRVVIIGGGFGGLKVATTLDPKYFQIVLLDKRNYHQFQPLFYQVATSGLEPSTISFPFRKVLQKRPDLHFRLCEALNVDTELSCVETTIGRVRYDYLVVATGCDTNFFGNQKLKESSLVLKSTTEAINMRNEIIFSLERAASTADFDEREKLLNFVIVGGGATGVELAGALAEMRKFVLPKDYPDFKVQRMRIYLVDGLPRLLNAFSEKASKEAFDHLTDLHVDIVLGATVDSYANDEVKLSNGDVIKSKNLIWVAGVKGNSIEGFEKDLYGRGNRIIVNEFNQVNGFKNVFAIGDTALVSTPDTPNGHPQVAQPAIQQGVNVANNLNNFEAKGSPFKPFKYVDKGSLATIGRNSAVAELPYAQFRGFFAWVLWLFVHIMTIVGVKNRLMVFINWMWSYITYDQSLRLLLKDQVPESAGKETCQETCQETA
ncbi:MAG: NAD(P)/FAD-dependent oxidoreductase [Bacteroidota bacterium]|nr:NAD(P)/FAD-dependent oxidoreductase [Bacteroidota bacterium]